MNKAALKKHAICNKLAKFSEQELVAIADYIALIGTKKRLEGKKIITLEGVRTGYAIDCRCWFEEIEARDLVPRGRGILQWLATLPISGSFVRGKSGAAICANNRGECQEAAKKVGSLNF